MKKSYENGFLIFILFLTVFFSWRSFAQVDRPCVIKKVFHHRGASDSSGSIEAGSCVLYFDAMPNTLPSPRVDMRGDVEVQTFFLPSVTLSGEECKRMVDRINNKDSERSYTIVIAPVHAPKRGISIAISYRKGEHSIECKQFEAIGRDKGLIFYVYNQKTLDALRMRREPLTQTVSTGRHPPRIFIDNGHGGSDAGAIGYDNVQEKDICLRVGRHLAHLLKKHGYDVILSRSTDRDVSLDQRTTAANRAHADMLISIHANSAANSSVRGIETFCMVPKLLKRTYSAMHEPLVQVVDEVVALRSEKSCALASLVQKQLCASVASYQNTGFDRGVKHAVAQVFFSQMPAILVELGFVTNPQESHLLANDSYQRCLAQAICDGICSHFRYQ